jgi:hypothetical protein
MSRKALPPPEGAYIIAVYGGETNEEARQRYLVQHPEHENAEEEKYIKTNLPREHFKK